MTGTCPDADRIRGLVDGSLSDAEADELQLHIESCQTCQAAIQELVADGSFWESVGEHLGTEQSSGPELERVMEELRQQSPEEAEQIGEAIELKLSFIDPPVEPGTIGRLQHYDILRVAGRGGMGIVVKAFDRSLRRVVAIKLLAPHLAGNGQARQRFVREGRAAAGICHEHVITIHAVEENPPYLVMQFVQGETLEARIHRNGALDFRETVRIAKQIAQGLAAAHAQGVVHRDIKPANILLENGVARVRITDFGLARAVDDASLTQSGVVAGTPQYMAPEQANGDAVDDRADLFSLGSVIYTMLTGHAPFRATTAMGVLKRLCDHSARPIREINPEVPDWLVLIINRLHAKRPADRFQSADEVATLLERGLASLQHGHAPVIEVRSVENEPAEADSREVAAALESRSSAQSSGKGEQARAVPRWLLRPIPLWIPLLPVPVFLAIFIANLRSVDDRVALAGIVTAATVLWLTWRAVAKGFESESVESSQSDAVRQRSRIGRFVDRALDLLPKSLHSLLLWTAVWALPVVVMTTAFAYEEDWAARGTQASFPDRGREMLATAVGVIYLWGVIAIVWFHRKRPNGSPLFPRARAKRVLFTLLLATVFCSYWLMVWFVDVQDFVDRHHARIARANSGISRVEARPVSRNLLKLEFDQPLSGTAAIIELANNERYRFTSEQGGVLMLGVGSQSGTFPWRAVVGHTEFASGDVTLAPDEVAEINVPPPKLAQLIAGRWQTMPNATGGDGYGMGSVLAPGSAEEQPPVWLEFNSHRLLLVTHEPQANRASGESPRIHRSDFSIEIDDSVEPALINLIGEDDRRIAGLVRFIPGHVSDGFGMEGASSMGMGMGEMTSYGGGEGEAMYGGMEGSVGGTRDRLEVCFNDGSGPRPWEFKANGQLGHELLRLQRSTAKESLREEMAFQPVPTGAEPQRVTEAVAAWAKKLKIQREGTNSLGMELVLVPPADVKHMVPVPPRITLPHVSTEAKTDGPMPVDVSEYADMGAGMMSNMRPAQIAVSYPFVIARQPVSVKQFQQFVDDTRYVTDAEKGTALPTRSRVIQSIDGLLSEPKNAPVDASRTIGNSGDPPIEPGGWKLAGDEFVFESDLKWQTAPDGEGGNPTVQRETVTQISWRDASEFCKWLSEKENRQYRLPTSHEWAASIQLGVTILPPNSPEAADGETRPTYSNFDARAEHLLGLQTPQALFAEWTDTRTDPLHRTLARKFVSEDGSRFGWSPQYSAGQTFRADSIGFRVVAELQVLSESDATEAPTEQP